MLVSLLAALSMAMNAEVIEYNTDDGFLYKLDTETKNAELTKYSGSAIDVVIPTSVIYEDTTYIVTSLGDYAFNQCSSLTAIDIPSSVTSIGNYCFSYCISLKSITVDKNNKVYDSRENCNAIIETATNTMISGCINTIIPSSVTSLGDNCFGGCSSLTSIDIPLSVTSLGTYCFGDCESLTSITIPSWVTSLGGFCFFGCSSLTSVDIPSSVTSLGGSCFRLCTSLTSINIPSSVTSIGNACFFFCSSLKIVICKIPTAIKGGFFFDVPFQQATLYVPEASLESYKTTSPWSNFGTILPITSTGIKNTSAIKSNTIDAVYDLDGKRSNGTNRGVNIIRMTDGTTRKVMK